MVKYLQCIFCCFFVCASLVAQPTFTISSVDVAPGEVFSVQVSAENLVNISSMQFSVNWDPAICDFQQVKDFGIPDFGVGNFGTQQVDDGKIGMLWFDNSASSVGFTAPQVNLFKLEFKAAEGITQVISDMSFAGMPVSIEIADTTFMDIGMIPVNGVINVLDPNDIEEEINAGITIGQLAPNPFSSNTSIPVEITKGSNINIKIITITGAQIYEHTEFIHPGLHKINIPGDIFPANGTYLCSLLIGEKKVAKKLFYNGK